MILQCRSLKKSKLRSEATPIAMHGDGDASLHKAAKANASAGCDDGVYEQQQGAGVDGKQQRVAMQPVEQVAKADGNKLTAAMKATTTLQMRMAKSKRPGRRQLS